MAALAFAILIPLATLATAAPARGEVGFWDVGLQATVPHFVLPRVILTAGPAIIAPDTVDPRAEVSVVLAEMPDGTLEMWGPITEPGESGTLISTVPVAGGQARFLAPAEPGSYEIRHLAPDGRLLARRTLDVSAWQIMLRAETPIGAGASIPVIWHGPARPGDRLVLRDPATGEVLSEAPAIGVPGDPTRTELPPPARGGAFEVAYLAADGSLLQRIPVRVRAPVR